MLIEHRQVMAKTQDQIDRLNLLIEQFEINKGRAAGETQ